MPRIAIAGFQHETNSFGIGKAGLAEFEMADSWPGLLTGAEAISGTHGMNLPIAGFAAAAQKAGATLCPILWCAAEPSGPVTDEAFDAIATRILDGLAAAMPLDGVYLDLHGAMITQSHFDGEGALLGLIRAQVGPDLPIAISLDMHANLSEQLVQRADSISIFKTYPHLDMAETGARAWARLQQIMSGARFAKAFRRAPFLVPVHAQATTREPARGLYADLPAEQDRFVELAFGFTAGDTPIVGPSVIAHAPTQAKADALAEAELARFCAAKSAFDTHLATPEEAVAMAQSTRSQKPVVLADVQDNPGAGASSDTTGLLRALVDGGAQNALLGLMHDPDLARSAHAAGVGAVISGPLGGRSGLPSDAPFEGRFEVLAVRDSVIRYSGEMYGGGHADPGLSCALRILSADADVTVVVTSIRIQCLDLALFTHFGLKPEQARIIAVKSTVHFLADFEPIASRVIFTQAPGLFPCSPTLLDRRGLGKPM